MAESKQQMEWQQTAVLACTLGNVWRTQRTQLKLSDFPYCTNVDMPVRMATEAEWKAFVDTF